MASTEEQDASREENELRDDENNCYVALTEEHLDVRAVMDRVRSPGAGAIVIFAGTTRDNFDGKPVRELQYSAYRPLALRTMMAIARGARARHALHGFAMLHRLGVVPVGEESILIAVSAPHRRAAWRAGEEALEECKARVEVWKREEFEDGGVWRANRDGVAGQEVVVDGGGREDEEEGEEDNVRREEGEQEQQQQQPDVVVGQAMGPVIRPRRPGEKGHGAVVNFRPAA